MKHKRIEKQLSAYLDDELSPAMRQKVDAHLQECQGCADMLSDFKQNRQRIAGLVHPAPPMKNAVLALIREKEATARKQILSGFRRWIFRPFTVGATAFSTLCLIVAFLYFFNPSPAPQSDETLDFYFGVYMEQLADNPLKSNVGTPVSSPAIQGEDIGDDTELFLNLYLGD